MTVYTSCIQSIDCNQGAIRAVRFNGEYASETIRASQNTFCIFGLENIHYHFFNYRNSIVRKFVFWLYVLMARKHVLSLSLFGQLMARTASLAALTGRSNCGTLTRLCCWRRTLVTVRRYLTLPAPATVGNYWDLRGVFLLAKMIGDLNWLDGLDGIQSFALMVGDFVANQILLCLMAKKNNTISEGDMFPGTLTTVLNVFCLRAIAKLTSKRNMELSDISGLKTW